jgi:DNA-binding XRE family transcriptional regulator
MLRRRHGWSQAELAKRAKLRRATVIALEQPHANPTLRTLERIAAALSVPIKQLFS